MDETIEITITYTDSNQTTLKVTGYALGELPGWVILYFNHDGVRQYINAREILSITTPIPPPEQLDEEISLSST